MMLAVLAALAAKPPPPTADAAKAAARALLSALEGSLDDCPTCAHEHRASADPLRVAVALDAHGNAHHSKASVLRDAAAGRGGAKLYAHAAALFPDDIAPALLEHAKALLKGKACTPSPSSWDVLGPFPIGKNEADGDPVAATAEGGAFAHWLAHHSSSDGWVPSELVAGGRVRWTPQKPAQNNVLALDWPKVPWSNLVQSLNQRAVLEVQAWVVGALVVAETGAYLLDCRSVHKALLYSAADPTAPPKVVAGDVYGGRAAHGMARPGFAVHLDAGVHFLALRVRTVVQRQVQCRLSAATEALSVGAAALPDILTGDRDATDEIRELRRRECESGRCPKHRCDRYSECAGCAESGCPPSDQRLAGGWVALPLRNSGRAGWVRDVRVVADAPLEVVSIGVEGEAVMSEKTCDTTCKDAAESAAGAAGADPGAAAAAAYWHHVETICDGKTWTCESHLQVEIAPGALRLLPVRLRLAAKASCTSSAYSLRVTARADGEAELGQRSGLPEPQEDEPMRLKYPDTDSVGHDLTHGWDPQNRIPHSQCMQKCVDDPRCTVAMYGKKQGDNSFQGCWTKTKLNAEIQSRAGKDSRFDVFVKKGTNEEHKGFTPQKGTPITLTARLTGGECRAPHQSVVYSYLDHDGAVSQVAVVRPLGEPKYGDHPDPDSKFLCAGSPSGHGCPVLLTLHGTSIPVRDSADAYKVSDGAGGFRFGVEGFWLVAPTRHGAHNWEQQGKLTALAAVDWFASIANSERASPDFVDRDRLLVVGHSMGGHGAWLTAVQASARVIGVVAVAGWLRKETYGDSNFLFEQSTADLSAGYVEPALRAALEGAIGEDHVELHAPNLVGVPVLIRVGAADNTVPPWWSRRAWRLLLAAGGNATLTELDRKEHWWWDTHTENDGGVMNDGEMRAFFARVASHREPETRRASLPPLAANASVRAFSPAAFEGRGGWRIVQQAVPGRLSQIDIRQRKTGETFRYGELLNGEGYGYAHVRDLVNGEGYGYADVRYEVTTRNVRRLEVPASAAHLPIVVDGVRIDVPKRPCFSSPGSGVNDDKCEHPTSKWNRRAGFQPAELEHTHLCRINEAEVRAKEAGEQARALKPAPWKLCKGPWGWRTRCKGRCSEEYFTAAERRPATAGPARQAMQAPFAVVAGSGGGDGGGGLLGLATFLANLFAVTSDASPPVVLDGALDGGASLKGAVNLLLVGGPKHNSATATVAAHWRDIGHAVSWRDGDGALLVDGCAYGGDGVGYIVLGPAPTVVNGDGMWAGYARFTGGLVLVVGGTSLAAARAAASLGEPTIPPMARAPFTNLVPDFAVVGPRLAAEGLGGLLAAGHFDHEWHVASRASYSSVCD